MKVFVNTGFSSIHNSQQCRYFFYEAFKQIVSQYSEHEFYFLTTPKNDNDFLFGKNCFTIKIKSQPQNNWRKKYWNTVKLPSLLRSVKPQIILQPVEYFSFSIKIPQVLMVCDELSLSKKINKTQHLITSTRSLKTKSNKNFKLDEKKIKVVYAAPDKVFKPVNEIIKRKTKEEFSSGYEYFLFIDETGSETTFINVLKAFSLFKNKQQSKMKLLVLSDNLSDNKNITEKIKTYKYREDVALLDDLEEQTIAEIIASAYLVLYFPAYECWCLPMMWAMQSGVAVIASNIGSTAEIGNTTVLYADASNHENIAVQMLLLYKDENLKSSLVENALQQVTKFSWENSAQQLWQVMLKAAE